LPPVVGTSLAILAEGCLFSRIFLSHPLAAAIGRISYPLYLWHWPLLVFPHAYLFRPLTTNETVLSVGAVRNAVGICLGRSPGNMKVSFQAARSIG
jgi:peptidoglycan/LPS O-acetylase OafA/YrhL